MGQGRQKTLVPAEECGSRIRKTLVPAGEWIRADRSFWSQVRSVDQEKNVVPEEECGTGQKQPLVQLRRVDQLRSVDQVPAEECGSDPSLGGGSGRQEQPLVVPPRTQALASKGACSTDFAFPVFLSQIVDPKCLVCTNSKCGLNQRNFYFKNN